MRLSLLAVKVALAVLLFRLSRSREHFGFNSAGTARNTRKVRDVSAVPNSAQNVSEDFPQFPVARTYAELRDAFRLHAAGEIAA